MKFNIKLFLIVFGITFLGLGIFCITEPNIWLNILGFIFAINGAVGFYLGVKSLFY